MNFKWPQPEVKEGEKETKRYEIVDIFTTGHFKVARKTELLKKNPSALSLNLKATTMLVKYLFFVDFEYGLKTA